MIPAHTKLKTRQLGQHTREEMAQIDLKSQLLEKEARTKSKQEGSSTEPIASIVHIKQEEEEESEGTHQIMKQQSYDDSDASLADSSSDEEEEKHKHKKRRIKQEEDVEESDEEDSSDEDSEDEELLKELKKITKTRTSVVDIYEFIKQRHSTTKMER